MAICSPEPSDRLADVLDVLACRGDDEIARSAPAQASAAQVARRTTSSRSSVP